MKRILITGKDSYIGTSFENWLMKEPDKYQIDTLDMRDESWKEKDFSAYDVVFHVAGIAHIKETPENQDLYYKVNRDLAFETAQKAKLSGVNQFIFLSSMSVYGIETGVINEHTPTVPKSAYGDSKLEAEELIGSLVDDSFIIAIIRPPMVYGKGCKGNYPRLAKLALKSPIFPLIDNERSMIHIDNLTEFLRFMIDNREAGIFHPQNKEYVKTSEMVKVIAEVHGKEIKLMKLFNPIFTTVLGNLGIIQKVFGNLRIQKEISSYKVEYRVHNLIESIRSTEH